jgi:Uri superfamily endonuclease
MGDRRVIPDAIGTYLLILRLDLPSVIRVGRLGNFQFPAGYYLYCGSAMGYGGLQARLKRHLAGSKKPHWHIDWLRVETAVTGYGIHSGSQRLECTWSQQLAHLHGASIPAPGFGASDCLQGCLAHLVHFRDDPLANHKVKLEMVNIWRML